MTDNKEGLISYNFRKVTLNDWTIKSKLWLLENPDYQYQLNSRSYLIFVTLSFCPLYQEIHWHKANFFSYMVNFYSLKYFYKIFLDFSWLFSTFPNFSDFSLLFFFSFFASLFLEDRLFSTEKRNGLLSLVLQSMHFLVSNGITNWEWFMFQWKGPKSYFSERNPMIKGKVPLKHFLEGKMYFSVK